MTFSYKGYPRPVIFHVRAGGEDKRSFQGVQQILWGGKTVGFVFEKKKTFNCKI